MYCYTTVQCTVILLYSVLLYYCTVYCYTNVQCTAVLLYYCTVYCCTTVQCTAILLYSVLLYYCTVYTYTHVQCTDIFMYSVQLYYCTLYCYNTVQCTGILFLQRSVQIIWCMYRSPRYTRVHLVMYRNMPMYINTLMYNVQVGFSCFIRFVCCKY